ncbi:CBS domain-containing protein [Alphaproteobacteria bacterium]|nr:CBS domain-containing protein [Alphaproteobacteria bacterium]
MNSIGDIEKVKLNAICRFFGPESTVSEIADMMDLQDIGAVPIVDENSQLLGVVSERDIVRKLVKNGRDSDLVTAKDIMTSQVITVTKKTSQIQALRLMKSNNIRHLPIVDGSNKLLNFISFRDIFDSSQSNKKINFVLIGFAVILLPAILIFN